MSLNFTCYNSGWLKDDDLTNCGRHLILESAIPGTVAILSFVYFILRLIIRNTSSKYTHHSNHHSTVLDSETQTLLSTANSNISTIGDHSYGAIKLGEEEPTVTERHFDIKKLVHKNEDGSDHGHIEYAQRDLMERFRVALEEVLIVVNIGLSIAAISWSDIQTEYGDDASNVPYIKLFIWCYTFVLCTIRLLSLSKFGSKSLPNLWKQSVIVYTANFLPSIFTFRSALIGNVANEATKWYYIINFITCSLITLSIYTAKVGDKPPRIYHTAAAKLPSPEPKSSLLDLMNYQWVNKMITSAYGKSLTMDDIWGLREEDYAFNVLQGFESMKSTYKFTGRCFKYFRYLLLVQAAWTSLDSFLVFAPPLLLKKILDYVENQETTPKSLAWLFVFMMLAFKFISTSVNGRSLFLGRRLCIRLRAIIIGEVYAKALRRRVTFEQIAKVEDEDEDEDKKSTLDEENSPEQNGEAEEEEEEKAKTSSSADLGSIINLMAVDAFKVSELCGYLHYFVSAFIMIVISIVFLYRLLGWSALLGAAVLFVLLPINYKMARFLGEYQKEMLQVTDKRIQKLNEAFQSIRIIKFFGWEEKFAQGIIDVREQELYKLKMRCIVWSISAVIWFTTPTLITLFSFYCFIVIDGNTLTPPIAFTSLALFNLLRNPLDQLADMSSFVIQSKVSIDRVQKFLDEEDTTKYVQLTSQRGANSPTIGFENATFAWSRDSDTDFKLRDLNIDFKVGKLNVVIGPTGCGKTSLLLALLGEMDLTEGGVFLPGTEPRDELIPDPTTGLTEAVAYCAQAAWLLNDTIKNNITFASPHNEDRYNAVIKACGLERDFQILDNGDQTEVGEKGITLSGGQKQRVSLARALYSNARHVLLDDCLSAVDSHTALWIYENCITGELMKDRTCILVSHNVALTVAEAEWVVVLDNGRVKNQGSPTVLLQQGDLGDDELVKTSVMSRANSTANLAEKGKITQKNAAKIEAKLKEVVAEEEQQQKAITAAQSSDSGTAADEVEAAKIAPKSKLVQEETKSSGSVKFAVYAEYAKDFGSPFIWFNFFFWMLASQLVYMYQSWWLRTWSMASESGVSAEMAFTTSAFGYQSFKPLHDMIIAFDWHRPLGGEAFRIFSEGQHSPVFYIAIYSLIGFAYSVCACLRILIAFFGGIYASRAIFERMLYRVLRAKLRFFDSTPIGRIMNRFSKDIESIDQELAPCAEGFILCIVQCVAVIILICSITPAFIVFAFVVLFLYYLVGTFYLAASRELKRYESTTRSPIHQHFTETLVGVPTIRAYGDERRFMLQNLHKVDENNRPFFYLWVSNRWLAWRVDFVGSLVSFFAGVFILLAADRLDSGLAGLSLSYAIAFADSALWVVRLYSNVEMNMNSTERLQEYMHIDQEPPALVPENEPPSSWPDKGAIEVKDLSLRYAPELPRVIKNVTFSVEPTQKIGIVGRTGAGKSTIITAFFRFLDPETGSIHIDGVDITKIGLKTLRQGITIIPQDPTLFTGTIRSNLDMFGEYSDYEIFEALKRVNLISHEEAEAIGAGNPSTALTSSSSSGDNVNKFLNLKNPVAEGGSNLSQGQRQLMCLARSLLKAPKVILLDEATASIDYASDAKIQHTIRDEFSGSTILTIAHRLRSIIDYDKILVMDAGEVVEYQDPYTLIVNKSSLFHSMCENSGELDVLIQLAKDAFIRKKSSNSSSK